MSATAPIRIGVAVPSGDLVQTDFAFCLADLRAKARDLEPEFEIIMLPSVRTAYIATSRYTLAKTAMQERCQFVLWLDADMSFPADTLERLLSHNKSIVAANYVRRKIPPIPVTFKTFDPETGTRTRCYTYPDSTGLEEVFSVGFGVCLTRIDALTSVPPPGFLQVWERGIFIGEDVYFCREAAKAGHPTFVDHDLSKAVRHVGTFAYGVEHVLDAPAARPEEPVRIVKPTIQLLEP